MFKKREPEGALLRHAQFIMQHYDEMRDPAKRELYKCFDEGSVIWRAKGNRAPPSSSNSSSSKQQSVERSAMLRGSGREVIQRLETSYIKKSRPNSPNPFARSVKERNSQGGAGSLSQDSLVEANGRRNEN